MAGCRRIKTVQDARRDLISQLPADVKERILECLPTRDAARTALLSTHWRDVWLGHGRLVFDSDFFRCLRKCEGDKRVAMMKIITYILLHRARPVKKFILVITSDPMLEQSDLDQWFLFLSRNGVEELNISIFVPNHTYKLPSCIFSCRTIKKLILCGLIFYWPINASSIFPGVTSLVFKFVQFSDNVNGIVYSIPNLEKLAFDRCEGISNFEISAPKLKSLSAIGFMSAAVESKWFTLYLKAIKTLCLNALLLSHENFVVAAPSFPTAINLQVIKLYYLHFASEEQLTVAIQLLQKSPNLCELEIIASHVPCSSSDDIKAASRLLEDPNSCIINQDMKMLNTIKIEKFSGSTLEMLFVKMLLSKSPTLERVVIQEYYNMDASTAVKILRELVRFPRASTKAQIVCMDCKSMYRLVGKPSVLGI